MEERRLREPLYEIIWKGKRVERDLSPYLLSLQYTDHLHGKADELSLTFEDRDDRWKTSWFPEKGDVLKVRIGLRDDKEEVWLNCGSFQIEEIELSGPPDVVSIKGKSIFATTEREQKRSTAYENITLSELAQTIAKRLNLTPKLQIDPDIRFNRLDQKGETDLAFLKRLSDQYGYILKVWDNNLIMYKEEKLENEKPAVKVSKNPQNIISFRFSNKTCQTYSACIVKYWDPEKKREIVHIEKDLNNPSGSTLKVNERCENLEQARELARGKLKKANKWTCESELTLSGNPRLSAGASIEVRGFGKYDGVYVIEEAVHSLSKGEGYITSIRIRRK